MLEGTSFEKNEVETEENAVEVQQDASTGISTKIGEISEFEKDLIADSDTAEDASTSTLTTQAFENDLNLDMLDFDEGDVVRATYLRVEHGMVYVDFNYKSEGFFELSEIKEDLDSGLINLEEGSTLEVMIEKLETKTGETRLSYRKAKMILIWEKLNALMEEKTIVSVNVKNKVEGGLIVSYADIKGFIPASQISKANKDKESESLIGTKLDALIIQVDQKRKKLVLSNRSAESKAIDINIEELLAKFEEGQTYEGKVTSITSFGAFVDLGGIEGLVHISEMSWSRISHPSEVLNIGDSVKVLLISMDKEEKKLSLGMKQLLKDPWESVEEDFKIGQIVKGEVSRIVSFGAFIKLEDNLEGLIHISELSYNRVENIEEITKVGENLELVVIKVNSDEQKIGLSLKQVDKVKKSIENGESVSFLEDSAPRIKENRQHSSSHSSSPQFGENEFAKKLQHLKNDMND